MDPSSQHNQNTRPTLPPIRDLFRGNCKLNAIFLSDAHPFMTDELSRRPSLQMSPPITLARLRLDDDGDTSYPRDDAPSRSMYRVCITINNLRDNHSLTKTHFLAAYVALRPDFRP